MYPSTTVYAVADYIISYSCSSPYTSYRTSKSCSWIVVDQVICNGRMFWLCKLNIQSITCIIFNNIVLSHRISTGITWGCYTPSIILYCAILQCEILAIVKVYPVIAIVVNYNILSIEVWIYSVDSVSAWTTDCQSDYACICSHIEYIIIGIHGLNDAVATSTLRYDRQAFVHIHILNICPAMHLNRIPLARCIHCRLYVRKIRTATIINSDHSSRAHYCTQNTHSDTNEHQHQ